MKHTHKILIQFDAKGIFQQKLKFNEQHCKFATNGAENNSDRQICKLKGFSELSFAVQFSDRKARENHPSRLKQY